MEILLIYIAYKKTINLSVISIINFLFEKLLRKNHAINLLNELLRWRSLTRKHQYEKTCKLVLNNVLHSNSHLGIMLNEIVFPRS